MRLAKCTRWAVRMVVLELSQSTRNDSNLSQSMQYEPGKMTKSDVKARQLLLFRRQRSRMGDFVELFFRQVSAFVLIVFDRDWYVSNVWLRWASKIVARGRDELLTRELDLVFEHFANLIYSN